MPESQTAREPDVQRRVPTDGIARSETLELRVIHGWETVTVAVVHLVHTSRSARASSELVSVRQYPAAEWSADPLLCMEDELTLIAASRLNWIKASL